MKLKSRIETLDISLLARADVLDELTHWLRVMNRPNGWHYDLDHIWLLEKLAECGIGAGDTVIDAGAGHGIFQYVLAARGINVLSVDFSPRRFPARAEGIFNIAGDGLQDIAYKHSYMDFINYGSNQGASAHHRVAGHLMNPSRLMRRAMTALASYRAHKTQLGSGDNANFGKIEFIRSPFHSVDLPDACADAVVSVSAIEHADKALLKDSFTELARLLRPGGQMFITTSSNGEAEDTFDDKTAGWCFSGRSLSELFNGNLDAFDPVGASRRILNSETFRRRVDPYYAEDRDSPFFKRRYSTLPYVPVGVAVQAI